MVTESEVRIEYDELGFVKAYVCPNCGSPVKLDHVDDVGTKWFKCEKCGQQSSRLKSVEKEKLLERLKDIERPITLNELNEILETTVKYDATAKQITFLYQLLNYTDDCQQNIGFSSESARGKSYLALELSSYFPEQDIDDRGYVSPTGFFHERGILVDEMGREIDFSEKPGKDSSPAEKELWKKRLETAKLRVDLSHKILIFLDQPHDQLLQRLRPILSHDKKIIEYSITDKSERYGLRTKHVQLVGYPTVIFCSAKGMLDEQEKTRLVLLSPGAEQEKLIATTKLIVEKESNCLRFLEKLRNDPKRSWLQKRVAAIKDENISDVIIPDPEKLHERFLEKHKVLVPRHQRDLRRLIALIKAHALLNCFNRHINHSDNPEPHKTITATDEDIEAGFQLYEKIRVPNEMGVTPEILEIYENIIQPGTDGLSLKGILEGYAKHYNRLLSFWRLEKEIILVLLGAGLISEDRDPNDKRKKIFHPTLDTHLVSNTEKSQNNMRVDPGVKNPKNTNHQTLPLRNLTLDDIKRLYWADQIYGEYECSFCGYKKQTSWKAELFKGPDVPICEDCKSEWEKKHAR
jgi:Zn ribbon nucleic-acid-binding protein